MSLISSMNPTAPINTRPEAIAAARASAIAIAIGVVWGIVTVIYLSMMAPALMETAFAEAAQTDPNVAEMEGMAGMMSGFLVGWTIFMVICQVVLGLVQWFKPNIVIPILFTVLVVFGLGSALLSMMGPAAQSAAAGPLWFTVLGLVVLVVELVLHIAGIRGASAMNKLRDVDQDVF